MSLKASMELLNWTIKRVNDLAVGTDIQFNGQGGQTSVITVFGLEHIILLTNLRKSDLWNEVATLKQLVQLSQPHPRVCHQGWDGNALQPSHPRLKWIPSF